MGDDCAVEQVHDRAQVHFAAGNVELGDITDPGGIGFIPGEVAIKDVWGDTADRARVGDIRSTAPDLGFQPHLVHEFVYQLVIDYPAFVAQVAPHAAVPVTVLVGLEAVPNRGLKDCVFIRARETFLVVEKCRSGHTGNRQKVA